MRASAAGDLGALPERARVGAAGVRAGGRPAQRLRGAHQPRLPLLASWATSSAPRRRCGRRCGAADAWACTTCRRPCCTTWGACWACAASSPRPSGWSGGPIDGFRRQGDPRLEGAARTYLAEILIAAGDFAGAERGGGGGGRDAGGRAVAAGGGAGASGARAAGRAATSTGALAAAREAHDALERLGEIEEGESMVRLAYAEALGASGRRDEARAALAVARQRLLARAERIGEPAWRHRFLHEVPVNARILALAEDRARRTLAADRAARAAGIAAPRAADRLERCSRSNASPDAFEVCVARDYAARGRMATVDVPLEESPLRSHRTQRRLVGRCRSSRSSCSRRSSSTRPGRAPGRALLLRQLPLAVLLAGAVRRLAARVVRARSRRGGRRSLPFSPALLILPFPAAVPLHLLLLPRRLLQGVLGRSAGLRRRRAAQELPAASARSR